MVKFEPLLIMADISNRHINIKVTAFGDMSVSARQEDVVNHYKRIYGTKLALEVIDSAIIFLCKRGTSKKIGDNEKVEFEMTLEDNFFVNDCIHGYAHEDGDNHVAKKAKIDAINIPGLNKETKIENNLLTIKISMVMQNFYNSLKQLFTGASDARNLYKSFLVSMKGRVTTILNSYEPVDDIKPPLARMCGQNNKAKFYYYLDAVDMEDAIVGISVAEEVNIYKKMRAQTLYKTERLAAEKEVAKDVLKEVVKKSITQMFE